MKNLLTRWETEEENRKIGRNMLFIDRKHSGNVLLINRERSGNVLLLDREFAKLENDAKYTSLPKLTEVVKKPSKLTRTRKEKPHCPISHSFTYFVEPNRRPSFCFVEGLTGLTDGLAMGGVELRGGEIAVSFSR